MENHKIEASVFKDYQFEQVIAAHTGSDGTKRLMAVCNVGKSIVEYEVRRNVDELFGVRTRHLELAVEVYNSI